MEQLKVGYSSVVANPPMGIGIDGYYVPRFAKGNLDDIGVRAIALTQGEIKILLMSVDSCMIHENTVAEYAALVEKETGISPDNIVISATHTHTGPFLAPTTMFEADPEPILAYAKFLGTKVLEAAKLALADAKPARMGYIVGYAPERVAYIRRYKMKDGSTWTCPPINDPNIDHPIGTLDQRVNVLRFDREGAESVVLVNYGVHTDTVNGEMLSADWPAWMAKTLDKALDGVKCMFICGAQGDVGSTNVHPTGGDMNDTEISFDNEMKSPGMARFVGRALAGTVLQVYDKVNYVDDVEISITNDYIKVPSNMPTVEQLPLAKEYKAYHDAGRDDLIPYTAMELTTVVAEAIRMCELENGPEDFTVRLTGVKLGPVALVGIPGEPFTDVGVAIKDTPGWDLILPCALTNGYLGYFPMQSAFDEGGYEARTSRFRGGVAERIIQGSKELLSKM